MKYSRSRFSLLSRAWVALGLVSFGFLAGCGSGSSNPPPVTTYTIGGTAINLVGMGGGLQLQLNGGDSLLVNENGAFTFSAPLAAGTEYTVTVSAQPSAPAQLCEVTHGTGTATADVTTVAVDCGHNEWMWASGSNTASQVATYGTEGTAAPENVPGARGGSITWVDAAGNLWLFGGSGAVPQNAPFSQYGYYFNDLWKYSGGEWAWMSGSSTPNQTGTYGTQVTPAPGNVPGARQGSVSWTDSSGSFWLFGGVGYDSTGSFFPNFSYLNDLWKYSAGQWTWMGGSSVSSPPGYGSVATYGAQGVAAPGNVPGGRVGAASWTDKSGNFWLFGGLGYATNTWSAGFLNDLWKYSGGQWIWMSGSNTTGHSATYGTQGVAAPGNTPGAESDVATWTDTSGNLWLFDGALWKFSAGEWTWMGGTPTNSKGVYGTVGTPAADNMPGPRSGSTSWTDPSGNFWLFGGYGIDSTGALGDLNDLWKYSAGKWTWMGGSNIVGAAGIYGTQGVAAPGNVPGARVVGGATWSDASGNLWLFGAGPLTGFGPPSPQLNDLWKYEP